MLESIFLLGGRCLYQKKSGVQDCETTDSALPNPGTFLHPSQAPKPVLKVTGPGAGNPVLTQTQSPIPRSLWSGGEKLANRSYNTLQEVLRLDETARHHVASGKSFESLFSVFPPAKCVSWNTYIREL